MSADPPEQTWRTLAEVSLPSAPGNERLAMAQVAAAVAELGLTPRQVERLETAVAEATMNAMEHGNRYRDDLPVDITVRASAAQLCISIRDAGGGQPIPAAETPDLEAKLAGAQSPRGWGLFLIKSLVDEMRVTSDDQHHTVELVLYLNGDRP